MISFQRIFWPVLTAFGVLFYLTLVHFISISDPYYVYNDNLVNLSLLLIATGVIGSITTICFRYGLKKSSPLLLVFGVAFLSLVALYAGDDLSSLGWAFIAYPAVIIGTILIIVYSVRNPK